MLKISKNLEGEEKNSIINKASNLRISDSLKKSIHDNTIKEFEKYIKEDLQKLKKKY
jgi:hypothetical protein